MYSRITRSRYDCWF